jgi:hypothetical protein
MDDEKTAGGGVARGFADCGWRWRQGFVIWGDLFVCGRREDPGGLLIFILFFFYPYPQSKPELVLLFFLLFVFLFPNLSND